MNLPQESASAHEDEIDVIALIRLLWKRKIAIIVIAILFALASVFYAMTATHIFRAQVVITKVSEANMGGAASLAGQFGGLANLAGISVNGGGGGREAQAILESRYLVEQFITRNELLSELSPNGGEPLTLWRAVKQFQEILLTIREDTTGGKTTLEVSYTDPVIAAKWANQFVALANELIRTRALNEAAANIEYLNKQIERTNVVGIQNVMYNLIESETKTAMLANARDEYAFTVVDPAVAPEVRSSPNRKLIVVSGAALGVFLGILFVLVLNFVARIRSNV